MYETILLTTDGSDGPQSAVGHGLELADTYGATVHALYVVDTTALSLADEEFDHQSITAALERRGRRAVEAISQQARDRGIDAVPVVVSGSPAGRIRDYADKHDCDLIAMGTRGRSGIARHLLGSVAESVLGAATQPVLTARAVTARATPTYDDILLPVDGSDQADRAADHAFDIASRYDATVHALSVIESGLIRSSSLLASLETESEQAINDAVHRGKQSGVTVVPTVWRGQPHRCLTTFVDERDVDLLVMGGHDKRGLDRFLTTGVVERVVRTANCPVISLGSRR